MSALDMVLQRQVPARSVAKPGEGATGADTAGETRNDAFSAALSNERRSAAAERDKVDAKGQDDADAYSEDPDGQVMTEAGQSDEILNLLSGLKSSAAYSDDAEFGIDAELGVDAELGNDATAVPPEPEVVSAEDSNVASDTTADIPVTAILSKPDETAFKDANETQTKSTVAETKAAGAGIDQNAAEAVRAAPVGAAQAAESEAGQMSARLKSSEAAPATMVSAAAAGMTGQGTQAQAKSATTQSGADRLKDPSAVKEATRSLGLDKESQSAEAQVAKTSVRGRNASKQGGAERQIEEPTAPKSGKVEVIESRRFMPVQNMSANAQALTRSLAEAGGTALAAQRTAPAQSVVQTGQPQSGQMLHTLKLQLNPVSLGSVTAVLKLSGDDLSVEIKVQTAEAYRQLKDDNQSIVKALRAQGFGVEQITVQHVTGPDRSSSQTSQQGFQAGQQGADSNDTQSSGRENGRNGAGQQGASPQGGQGHEQASYSGPGAGRTDGVYL